MNIRERAEECLLDEDCTCSPAKEIIRDLLAELEAYKEDHEGEDVYELIKKIQTLRVDKDDLLAENERLERENKQITEDLEFAYRRSKVLADKCGIPVHESPEVTGTILGLVRGYLDRVLFSKNELNSFQESDQLNDCVQKMCELEQSTELRIAELIAENERLEKEDAAWRSINIAAASTVERLENEIAKTVANTELRIADAIRQTAEEIIELSNNYVRGYGLHKGFVAKGTLDRAIRAKYLK